MKYSKKLLTISLISVNILAVNLIQIGLAKPKLINTNKIIYNPGIGTYGGSITVDSFSTPKTFNIYLASETSSTDILGQMYVGLVYTDPFTNEVKPELAESWTISPDKKMYTVKIRKGLMWSDGEPITAEDVVFTYNNVINNPAIPTNSRDGLLIDNQFPKVEKIDDLTVKFTTVKPFAPFLRSGLSSAIVPYHILSSTVHRNKAGKIPFLQWANINSEPKDIICNGPFKLKEYIPDEKVVLERNDKYWRKDNKGQKLPYLEQIITNIAVDNPEEEDNFLNSKSDILPIIANFYQDSLAIKNIDLYDLGPDDGTLFFMFNLSTAKDKNGKPVVNPIKSSWFRNPKFRKALAYAINKKTIINDIYYGLASPQFSDISQQNPFYNPNLNRYNYDLKKSLTLLREAGFKKNKSDQLTDSKGNKIEFTLNTNMGNLFRDNISQLVKSDWENLGIKVNYHPVPFSSMVEQIDENLNWDSILIGLTGSSIEPHGGINTWKTNGRMHLFNMGNAKQDKKWQNRETSYSQWEKDISKLWEKASVELDPVKRKALYWKAQEIVSENIPLLFTVNKEAIIGVNNRIGNVFPNIRGGSGLNSVLWNSFELYIK